MISPCRTVNNAGKETFTSPFQIFNGEELILPLPMPIALFGNGFLSPLGIKRMVLSLFFFSLLLQSPYHM